MTFQDEKLKQKLLELVRYNGKYRITVNKVIFKLIF